MKVFIVTYEHRHGVDVAAYATRELADAGIAREYWEDRPEGDTPDDHSAMSDSQVADAYFADNGQESVSITETHLIGAD